MSFIPNEVENIVCTMAPSLGLDVFTKTNTDIISNLHYRYRGHKEVTFYTIIPEQRNCTTQLSKDDGDGVIIRWFHFPADLQRIYHAYQQDMADKCVSRPGNKIISSSPRLHHLYCVAQYSEKSCAGFQRRYSYTCVGCQAYIPGVSRLSCAEVRTIRSSSNHGGPEKENFKGFAPHLISAVTLDWFIDHA